ncbi:MAG: helix-turn-helix domain-containing protein [Oscillospiraceae bacterium]|nr:helix-turn-helix domain-containing protein [Oscillospiraceae bacterium]
MEDLKFITAANIISLRTKAGMTQAQLAELLNYSDKSVSKWERAEAVPDAYVLKHMSEIFGVSVDYLLSSHNDWEPISQKQKRRYRSEIIVLISMAGIWTLAFFIFIIGWILGHMLWLVFIYAVPISLITLLVFNSVWENGKRNYYIVSTLVASIFVMVYLTLLRWNPWQLLLLIIPAELIVFLAFRVKKPLQ